MRTGTLDLRRSIAIALALSSAVAAQVAIAEENTLEEVVVTARKRTENLQDVTASVSALSSKDLLEALRHRPAQLCGRGAERTDR